MSDYTPGPWQIQEYVNYEGWSIWGSGDGCIAERWYASPRDNSENARMQANARLIAAAPDMLELLEQLEWAGCDYLGNPICPRCEQRKTARHDMDCALNAAIKKAKGQL